MRWLALLLYACVLMTWRVDAKVFTRCTLARELTKYNFPRSFITNWVCLVESESGRSTSKVTGPLPNGSHSYGLFQINSKEWCRKGRKGGTCNLRCEDLTNDDINDDVRCAKKVYDRVGFNGWPAWRGQCKGRPLPDVSRCP